MLFNLAALYFHRRAIALLYVFDVIDTLDYQIDNFYKITITK